MLREGLELLIVQGEESAAIIESGPVPLTCSDVSMTIRAMIDQTFRVAITANPDATDQQARGELEALAGQESSASAALDAVRARNAVLGRQVGACRADLAEITTLLASGAPEDVATAQEIASAGCPE